MALFVSAGTVRAQTSGDVGRALVGQGTAAASTRWALRPLITVPDAKNMKDYADELTEPVKGGAVLTRVEAQKNQFHVEVPDIKRVEAQQKTDTLCWAACSQMVLTHDNVPGEHDQVKLGARFRPDREDKSANDAVIMRAINPDLDAEMDQKRIFLTTQVTPNTSDQLIKQLCANELVVVGLVENKDNPAGHVCIIYGATFGKVKETIFDPLAAAAQMRNVYAIYEVNVFDPWPDTDAGGGTRKLTGDQFKEQVQFLTSKPLAHDELFKALHPPQTAQNSNTKSGKTPSNPLDSIFQTKKKKQK